MQGRTVERGRRTMLGFASTMACAVALLGSVAGADGSISAQTRNWSDNFVSRVEALALLETLNSEL